MPDLTSSDSSSDDDDGLKEKLKEAAVTFESIKSASSISSKETEKDKLTSSKRWQNLDETDENDFNETIVTPEFKEFVAKKLIIKLDNLIEFIHVSNQTLINEKQTNACIQIFKDVYMNYSNNDFSQLNDNPDIKRRPKKSKKKKHKKSRDKELSSDSTDSEDNLEMLKEAAVDVNYLINTTSISQHKHEFISMSSKNKSDLQKAV